MNERFIGEIKRGNEECKVYICRDYYDGTPGEEYLFFRIRTELGSTMGVGQTVKGLVRLFNIDPPMGG